MAPGLERQVLWWIVGIVLTLVGTLGTAWHLRIERLEGDVRTLEVLIHNTRERLSSHEAADQYVERRLRTLEGYGGQP